MILILVQLSGTVMTALPNVLMRHLNCSLTLALAESRNWSVTILQSFSHGADDDDAAAWRRRMLQRRLLGDVVSWVRGAAKCPYGPTQNASYVITKDGNYYSATVADFAGRDAAVYRSMGPSRPLRTVQYNSRWLNGTCRSSSRSQPLAVRRYKTRLQAAADIDRFDSWCAAHAGRLAANQPHAAAAVYRRDRQTDRHRTVTQTLLRVLCGHRQ